MNRALMHQRAQRVLPADIQTCGLLQLGATAEQMQGMALDSAFGGDTQGVVVLRLDSATAVAIQRRGLAFFEQAQVARAGLSLAQPEHYGPWRRVSAMAEAMTTMGQGMCREVLSGWRGVAYMAAALGRNAWLAVLPVERLVVYGWGR